MPVGSILSSLLNTELLDVKIVPNWSDRRRVEMSTSSLIPLFYEFGIENNQQLEKILEKERDGGSWSSELKEADRPESFGLRISEILSESSRKGNRDDRVYGIQNFTYIGRQRILEENLKKGLFVSRRINFVTDYDFAVHISTIDCDLDSWVGTVDEY